ncbi:phage structural protein [Solilutibacter silvestris]|uniref:phage structural protein n=1 Tax=Solilutibacter silvestris TaxID=1645665 RepID=UPI003D35442A
MAGTTYSFLNVQAAITGPGGSFNIGQGAGVTDEGITIEPTGDKNTMTIGADGSGMHSLHADKSGNITVRLLKTSPTNAMLMGMYTLQTASAALHGQNVITVTNMASGDTFSCTGVAFKRRPTQTYAKDGQFTEWQFSAISIDGILGTY